MRILFALAVITALPFQFARSAYAADSVYTLLNPVPDDKMRELETDRPDKTNTPVTADAGHVIIETGIFDDDYNQDHYHGNNARSNTLSLGQFNFRLGILENLELNAVLNSVAFTDDRDYLSRETERQSSFGDTIIGGKFNFWGNDYGDTPWTTAFGIQPELKIPTARRDVGNAHAEATVGLPFLMKLPWQCDLGLQTTVGWQRNSASDGDVTGWQNSVTLDHDFTQKLNVYVEYWSYVTSERHQEAQATLDMGFVYTLNDSLQFDTGVNFGLNRASDSFEITSGITVRI